VSEEKTYGVWVDTSALVAPKMPSHWLCDEDGSDYRGTEAEARAEVEVWKRATGMPYCFSVKAHPVLKREEYESLKDEARTEARTEAARERDEVLATWREKVPHPSELDAYNTAHRKAHLAEQRLEIAVKALERIMRIDWDKLGAIEAFEQAQSALKRIEVLGGGANDADGGGRGPGASG
jgi:hypothetical protein